jgi:hypothetical protein
MDSRAAVQDSTLRPLAETELAEVNGGSVGLVAAGAAAFGIGVLAGYWYTAGNVTNGIRAALEQAGLR